MTDQDQTLAALKGYYQKLFAFVEPEIDENFLEQIEISKISEGDKLYP